MKKLTIISIALLFAVTTKADILTVNNINGSGAMYANIQEAIDSASAEDTILVHASPISYSTCFIDKALVIAGQGRLGSVSGTSTKLVGAFILNPGSSNTVITGFEIDGGIRTGSSSSDVNITDIKIINNYIYDGVNPIELDYDGDIFVQNVLIEGNIVLGFNGGAILDSRIENTGIVAKNNIFQCYSSSEIAADLNSTCILDHNLFITHNEDAFLLCSGVTLTNNIFYAASDTLLLNEQMPGGIFNNNVTYGAAKPLEGTNVHADPIFASFPDNRYMPTSNVMTVTNPALQTVATDGGVPGVYGGGYSFSMRSLPSGFPHIDALVVQKMTVTEGDNVQIRIQGARSGVE